MKINTVNLSTGNRFFIIEDFFEKEQYKSIVELFDQYTAENSDWFEDPRYSHAYAGRMVYRGESTTLTKLQELAASPEIVRWISQVVGQNLEYFNLSLWLDLPGYRVTPHYDQSLFEYAVQIYVPDPNHFFEMLGTCVYTDDDVVPSPLFEIHYRPNRGYLIDRTDSVKHGVNHAIPAEFRRQSVYLRYRIK
jgi:hypothetical protein